MRSYRFLSRCPHRVRRGCYGTLGFTVAAEKAIRCVDPFDAIGIFSMGLGMFLAAMTGVTIRYLPPTSSQVCHTRPRVRY